LDPKLIKSGPKETKGSLLQMSVATEHESPGARVSFADVMQTVKFPSANNVVTSNQTCVPCENTPEIVAVSFAEAAASHWEEEITEQLPVLNATETCCAAPAPAEG
jgi:hypothetical protein